MADFYPLLTRAIAALPKEAGAPERAAIYAKAREALARQLRGREPALPDADILREQMAFEEVVSRFERDTDRAIKLRELDMLEQFGLDALDADAQRANSKAAQRDVFAAPANAPKTPSSKQALWPMLAVVGALAIACAGLYFGIREPALVVLPDSETAAANVPVIDTPAAPEAMPVETPASKPVATPTPVKSIKPDPAPAASPAPAVLPVPVPATEPAAPKPVEPVPVAPVPAEPVPAAPVPAIPVPAEPVPAPQVPATPIPAAPADPVPVERPADLPVASRASIFEAPAAEGQPPVERRGAVVWRRVVAKAANGTDVPSINAQFEFPDARMNATLLVQRNLDPTLPATHNVSILFTPLEGAVFNIKEVLALEMRDELNRTGVRLDGVRAAPSANMVMVGLSTAEPSVLKNIPALRDKRWMYVDILFVDGRRGAMIFEKGATGDKVFAQVFAEWGR